MRSLILIAATLIASSAVAAEMVPVKSITVNGIAKRDVVPDEAHLSINLNSMEPKMAAAKAAHDAKIKKLMSIVKETGIDEKKVRTQSSGTQPVYEYREVKVENTKDTCVSGPNGTPCPPRVVNTTKNIRVLTGYRAHTTLDITVGDTNKLAGLLDAVTNAGFEKGANEEWGWGNLTSVYYTLSDTDKIRDEMLAQAIVNARDKATKMAAAAGSSIAGVYQITESGVPNFNFPRPMMMARGMSAGIMAAPKMADAEMAPPAGEQEVNANVTVMFELK